MRKQKGFTLLELLMVVIIIGILASIAMPQYVKTAERGRMSEALSFLGQIRASEMRYYAQYSTYVASANGIPTQLDIEGVLVGTQFFTYAVPTGAATLNIRAVRNNTTYPAFGCAPSAYRICIDQNGNLTGVDCQNTSC